MASLLLEFVLPFLVSTAPFPAQHSRRLYGDLSLKRRAFKARIVQRFSPQEERSTEGRGNIARIAVLSWLILRPPQLPCTVIMNNSLKKPIT